MPRELLDRDVRRAHVFCPELVDVLTHIYADTEHYWDVYETCEELVDIEENFQLWRFRHLKTVQRTIGGKTGTGGSSGARSCGVPWISRSSPSCTPCDQRSVRSATILPDSIINRVHSMRHMD